MPVERISQHGILVLDPSQHMLDIIMAMLRHIGSKDVRACTTTDAASAELHRRHFEVVVIDADITPIDAVAFVRTLRHSPECQNQFVPVIMMSSSPDIARISAARDAGVTEFLRKPFAAAHLQGRITSIRSAPRANLETSSYVGPDRRRRAASDMGQAERRNKLAP